MRPILLAGKIFKSLKVIINLAILGKVFIKYIGFSYGSRYLKKFLQNLSICHYTCFQEK